MKTIKIHVYDSRRRLVETDRFGCDECKSQNTTCAETVFPSDCPFAANVIRNTKKTFATNSLFGNAIEMEIPLTLRQRLANVQSAIQKAKNEFQTNKTK